MMLPTETEMVDICAALYDQAQASNFEVFQASSMAPYVGVYRHTLADVVILRGSKTPEDWVRDAESELARMVSSYPKLGLIPLGFGQHLAPTIDGLKKLLCGAPVVVAGHSLGAAEALLIGGALLCDGIEPAAIRAYEPPRSGMHQLAALLTGIDIMLTRNGPDPVCELPISLEPFLSWQQPAELTLLNEPPPPGDPWEMILPGMGFHHIPLVQQGIRKLFPA